MNNSTQNKSYYNDGISLHPMQDNCGSKDVDETNISTGKYLIYDGNKFVFTDRKYTISFFNTLLPCPVLHNMAETLTLVKDNAINVVEYSTNNGSTWTVYSVPVAAAANSETLWRVASFNSGYDKGCLILNIS